MEGLSTGSTPSSLYTYRSEDESEGRSLQNEVSGRYKQFLE